MMVLSLAQYTAVFLLGVLVSAMLSGGELHGRVGGKVALVCLLLLAVQLLSYESLGLEATKKLYPLIVHLPLWTALVLILETPKLQTAVSVLVAYMFCQLPRWVASLGLLLPETHWLFSLLYIPVAGVFLLLMYRFFAPPVRQLLTRDRWNCLLVGIVPALYYGFDYLTTVYTSMLLSGNMAAVQFMPSVVSSAFLFFVVNHHTQQEKQLQIARERDVLAVQLQQSGIALSAMQQIQEKTKEYRHDMRHHFNLLRAYTAQENVDAIRQYLATAEQDLDALTPVRYCGNEVVNMVLSYYAALAKAAQISFSVAASFPGQLPCRETEMCVMLSNGLENALDAAARVEDLTLRYVKIHIGSHSNNLLIQIENTYTLDLIWHDGLPCSEEAGHGLGTRSIRTIARSIGGEALFSGRDNIFQLRIWIPLEGQEI